MRIYIAGLIQETNTFSPIHTDIDYFRRGYILEGVKIKEKLKGTNTEIGGFYSFFEEYGGKADLIPGLAAWSVAAGKILDEAFEELATGILTRLQKARPVDGVLLALHGALISESLDDCEGYLFEKIREIVGDDVPIVSTLDYHAVLTEKMVETSDVLVGFRTYPHVDFLQTGRKAAKCMVDLVENKPRRSLKKIVRSLPMIVPVDNTETQSGPMMKVLDMLKGLDGDWDVLSTSIFCPHPWIDTQDMAITAVLYSYGSEGDTAHERAMDEVSDYIWRVRDEFYTIFPSVKDFLDRVEDYAKPVILVDSGDVTSAGARGDSTVVLRSLLENNIQLKSVLTIVDPNTAVQAAEMGEGRSGWFNIGGETDSGYNSRVRLYANVVCIKDNAVEVKGESFSGVRLNMGRRVLLQCRSISIIVSEYASLIHDPQVLRSMGLAPETQDIIVQKSHKLFRSAYKEIVRSIVTLDTPGFTDRNVKRLKYSRVTRPIYPLDKINEVMKK